jgi:hypothetical protein
MLAFLFLPSGCHVCISRIQKLSLVCLWFSFQLRLWSMIYIFDLTKSSNECPGDTKCWLTGKSVFFVRSLLCPFILLLNGWTLSPTYCHPQTWQTRRYTTLGVLQLTLQNIVYSFPVGLLWNTCACCNWIYITYRTLKRKHGNNNVFQYYIFFYVY